MRQQQQSIILELNNNVMKSDSKEMLNIDILYLFYEIPLSVQSSAILLNIIDNGARKA